MKNGNKNYLEMPKGLVKDYGLTAKPLLLYYILKEYEQAFCTNERHTFTVDDTRLKNAMGCGRNQLYEYKKILKEAGLIICRKNGYGICEYRLPYLNNYVDF